jgi:hypothetical protein
LLFGPAVDHFRPGISTGGRQSRRLPNLAVPMQIDSNARAATTSKALHEEPRRPSQKCQATMLLNAFPLVLGRSGDFLMELTAGDLLRGMDIRTSLRMVSRADGRGHFRQSTQAPRRGAAARGVPREPRAVCIRQCCLPSTPACVLPSCRCSGSRSISAPARFVSRRSKRAGDTGRTIPLN